MTILNARRPPTRRHVFVVAASLIVGFLLPIVLALGPAAGGGESRMTGAALLGWGVGWALIALLSIRFTDQPQRWALVPAGILGVTGIALIALAPGAPAMDQLSWVWPVPILVLAVWLAMRVRRDVQGRSRWLLYPVVGVLALLAVGGAVETVIEATDGSRSPNGGQLVDVGGHKLFIACSGTGSPTVVLEGGLGQGSDYFALIAPTSQRRRGCAPTTGPATAGASPRPARRTAWPSPATCMHSSRLRATTGPTSSRGTPLAGRMCASSRPRTPARLPESCCSTRMSPHVTPAVRRPVRPRTR